MRIFGYLLVLLAFILGYFRIYPLVVIPVALVTSFIFISARRKWLQDNPPAMPVSPIVDGIYLFFLHLLINFGAFALGYFFRFSPGF